MRWAQPVLYRLGTTGAFQGSLTQSDSHHQHHHNDHLFMRNASNDKELLLAVRECDTWLGTCSSSYSCSCHRNFASTEPRIDGIECKLDLILSARRRRLLRQCLSNTARKWIIRCTDVMQNHATQEPLENRSMPLAMNG